MKRRSVAFTNPDSHPQKSLALVFAQWCQATTYHGVADFYFARSLWGRIIWFGVVSAGLFFTLNQVIELTLDFVLEDKWLTSMYPEIPPDGVMQWPHIRICNRNVFSASKLKKAGITDPVDIAYLKGDRKGILFYDKSQADVPLYENATDLDDKIDEIKWRLRIGTPYALSQLVHSVSFTCKDVMVFCDGNKSFVTDRLFCNCSDFHVQTPDENGCFHVNASYIVNMAASIKGRAGAGYDSGLQFLIDPDINDYYPEMLYDETGDSGISMRLYFGSFNGDVLKFSSPIFLSPGSHAVVAMYLQKHRTRVRERRGVNLYHTTLPCMKEATYRWIQSTTPLRAICAQDCAIHLYVLQCQCAPQQLAPLMELNAPRCEEEELADCRNRTEADWHIGPGNFNFSRCVEDCKDPCEYDTISTKVTASRFPAANKVDALSKYLNSESSRNRYGRVFKGEEVRNFILMDLYHDSNEYRVIERVNRVSLDEVVSNIGGALGAWTGSSFISIFQCVVYFAYGVKALVHRLRDRVIDRSVIRVT